MNLEKVFFGFFILLAPTLNVAFVVGDIGNPEHHSIWLLFAAVVANLIATLLKLDDRDPPCQRHADRREIDPRRKVRIWIVSPGWF